MPIYLVCESLQNVPPDQREAMTKADVDLVERRSLGPSQLQDLLAEHLLPEFRETDSGLRYHEVESGTGARPEPGQVLTVHYTGHLADGTVVGDTYAEDQPFQFRLGQGEVVAAWDEAAALMKKGARALVVAPPELAFGEEGDGNIIPPKATLIYSIELLSIEASGGGTGEDPEEQYS